MNGTVLAVTVVAGVLVVADVAWWIALERKKDLASERSHAALEDGNYTDASRAMTEYARLSYQQRWPDWIIRLTGIGYGVFLGHYLGIGGSW